MPHAVPSAAPGLQALILCGPGVSLNTFTSNLEESPKALVPIANRPMVWYVLDFCYRMGVTSIFLITPPASAKAMDAALAQNPHLTSLPAPKAVILAPEALTETSGTADILRLSEVRSVLQGDFLVLPCDLVCEMPGNVFLEKWMVRQEGYGRSRPLQPALSPHARRRAPARSGGFGVWYPVKGDEKVKDEETDFIMTTNVDGADRGTTLNSHFGGLLSQLVYSTTTDTLNDVTEEKEHFPVRHGLVRKHGRVRVLNTYRDAHIYIFPLWILDFVRHNDTFDSISEDVVGWWAKCSWQTGLGAKLGLLDALGESNVSDLHDSDEAEVGMDVLGMSSTRATPKRVTKAIPPIFAYIHPADPQQPLIRRVDTPAVLLLVSLRLAKLPSIEEAGREIASPFAHTQKIAYPGGIAQRCTVTMADCLLGENVTVEEKSVIKESVIGANCQIRSGARLTRCVLMDGVVVDSRAQLAGCIIGRRAQIGKDCVLKDCEVQDGNRVPDKTNTKSEKFMIFEGLEDERGEMELDNEIEF